MAEGYGRKRGGGNKMQPYKRVDGEYAENGSIKETPAETERFNQIVGENGLDKDLVRRANNSALLYEAGDSISQEYDSFVKIVNEGHFSQEEKDKIIKDAILLFNRELDKRAKAPSWSVTGRGNLNVRQYDKNEDLAQKARAERLQFTGEIERKIESYKKTKSDEIKTSDLRSAIKHAEETGLKEITVGGTTYYKLRTNWTTKKPTPRQTSADKEAAAYKRLWG